MTDMTDNITLPREVVEQLLKMLEMVEPYADQLTDYSSTAAEWPLNLLPEKVGVAITALRAALAAPRLEVTVDPRLTPEEAAAISSALAAPKQEPVGWQERYFYPDINWWSSWYDCRPRMAHQPLEQLEESGNTYQWRPLYTVPPAPAAPPEDIEALRRDAERLDWLTERLADTSIDGVDPTEHFENGDEPWSVVWRTAIDTAIRGSKS